MAVALLVAIWTCSATLARADGPSCPEGVEADAAARFDEAANGYLACAARATSPGETAWALSRAARVLATKLFRFDEALALLTRLEREFPTDPRAIAAQGLAAELRDGRRGGDEPLRLYYSLRERPDLVPAASRIATLRRLTNEYPDFFASDWVLRTLAVELRGGGDVAGALAVLATMRERFAGTPSAAIAALETAATYFAAGRFTEAAAWYRRLPEFGGSQTLGEQNARRALAHRARQRVAWLAGAILASFAAWFAFATRWQRLDRATARDALREAFAMAPAWLLLVVVSFRTNPGIHRPIWWIAGSTTLLLTLSNLALLTRRPRRGARWLHAVLTVCSAIAIVYVSLYAYDLVFTLEETLGIGSAAG
ncbi:MAG: tetratricopeptide repeat protein [bacterium]